MVLSGYLTLAQAIKKYEGISLGYLSRQVKSGAIEGERVGNQWIVKEDSLRAWLAQKGKLQPEQPAQPEQAPEGAEA